MIRHSSKRLGWATLAFSRCLVIGAVASPVAGCALNEAFRAKAAATTAVDTAAAEYEDCLRNNESDCEREARILEVRRGTLERRSAEHASQAAAWQAAGKAMQEQNERQEQQQLEREKEGEEDGGTDERELHGVLWRMVCFGG